MPILLLAIAVQGLSPSIGLAADRWGRCLRQSAEALARDNRPPDSLVRAAFAACLPEEEAARQEHARTANGSGSEFSARLRGLWGQQLVTIISNGRQHHLK